MAARGVALSRLFVSVSLFHGFLHEGRLFHDFLQTVAEVETKQGPVPGFNI